MQLKFFAAIGLIISFGLIAPLAHTQTTTRSGSKIQTIIVDPGHGGTDAGARGDYSTEAQITLKLSLKLEELLKRELPSTRILITAHEVGEARRRALRGSQAGVART